MTHTSYSKYIASLTEAKDNGEIAILQALADADINAKIENDSIVVDKDDVKAAEKVLKKIHCNKKVKGGLNESVQGEFTKKIRQAKKGECSDILDDIKKSFEDKKINQAEYDMLKSMADRQMKKLEESENSEDLEEAVKPDLKQFMKDFNQAVSYFKEDVKESDTNSNWVGRLEYLANLCDKMVSKERKR